MNVCDGWIGSPRWDGFMTNEPFCHNFQCAKIPGPYDRWTSLPQFSMPKKLVICDRWTILPDISMLQKSMYLWQMNHFATIFNAPKDYGLMTDEPFCHNFECSKRLWICDKWTILPQFSMLQKTIHLQRMNSFDTTFNAPKD